MAMIGKIRRRYRRDKKSVGEIARATSLSRNTLCKWRRGPLEGGPKYRRGAQPRKLTRFCEALKGALEVDAHRPKHARRSALAARP